MKVLQVMAGGEHGGAETMYSDSVVALHQAGVEQLLVTRPNRLRDALWAEQGIAVRHARFPPRPVGWRTRLVLARAIRDFKPDVCHFWMGRAASYARPGGVPNIGWFGGPYDLKYYRNCRFFIGVTHELARHIVAGGASPENTVCIHTFADLPAAPAVDRAAFETPDGVPVLLSLARLHHNKALDVLLKALVRVPAAYLWLAGEGPLRDGLATLAAELGVAGRVRFLGWRTDRAALLAASDLCVFPSRIEPFGTVMVEAWAAGVPLVAAAAAGPKAYVEPEGNGLLVAVDDVDALAAAINRCLGDPALCRRLVDGGRRTYENGFTREVLVRDLLAFYRKARDAGPAVW
jgi:glycosyltransferase involved in cell wall biosynthesis